MRIAVEFASIFNGLGSDAHLVYRGELFCLLGPSGCGKSTTMNMIAGMLDPSHGEIRFDGRNMNGVPMAKRGVGFVFQNYAIFTHMTVRENLAYGLKARGVKSAEVTRRVGEIAELLQLTPMLDRRAAGLSARDHDVSPPSTPPHSRPRRSGPGLPRHPRLTSKMQVKSTRIRV